MLLSLFYTSPWLLVSIAIIALDDWSTKAKKTTEKQQNKEKKKKQTKLNQKSGKQTQKKFIESE